MAPEFHESLRPTPVIDGDHARVTMFANSHANGAATARDQAVCLYYAVRDGIRYDPYAIDLSVYHPFDQLGNAHMEHVRYRGEFLDLPLDQIKDSLQRHYGPLLSLAAVDFDEDVKKESSAVKSATDSLPPNQ